MSSDFQGGHDVYDPPAAASSSSSSSSSSPVLPPQSGPERSGLDAKRVEEIKEQIKRQIAEEIARAKEK
jgi:hypothetical protein